MDVCFTEFRQSRQFSKYNFWSGPTGLVKRSKQHKRVARYTCILIWLGGLVGLDVPVKTKETEVCFTLFLGILFPKIQPFFKECLWNKNSRECNPEKESFEV